jgi:DNA-binding transcriptional ArsR family regulator
MKEVILKHMLNKSSALNLLFSALADPARRAMVERLSRGPAAIGELAKPLPMSLSAVMQHVAVLEAAGVVRTQKLGRLRTCSLDTRALHPVEQWIHSRRTQWERRLDRLGSYLADLPKEDSGDAV